MKVDQIIQKLAETGVYLAVRNGQLVCKAEKGALTAERRALINERKSAFIEFLSDGNVNTQQEEPALKARTDAQALLSPAQKRLLFVEQLTGSGANYTIPIAYRLSGLLNISALEKALRRIVQRHESLRSVVDQRDGEFVVSVRNAGDFSMEVDSIEALHPHDSESEVRARLQEAVTTPFDLTHDIPIRVRLLRIQSDEHVLFVTLHHTAADGWSVENLLQELTTLYSTFVAGEADPLPELTLQYSDYAAWQREWLQGERLERQLEFWRGQLAGAPTVHNLPLDRARSVATATSGATWRQPLPLTLHHALANTAQREEVTLFMLLQAAFAVLIARWSGETDIVMGTPVANRPRGELAPLIGIFANTLAFRNNLDQNPRFSDVLQQTRKLTFDALDHQHLPFELLVEDLNPPRSLGLAPVIQITFSLQDTEENASFDLPGMTAAQLAPDSKNAKFDLSLSINKVNDGFEATWDYCSDIFDEDTIARMAASFEVLLQGIVEDSTRRIQRLPLISKQDRAEVLASRPEPGYPRDANIAALVSEHVSAQPEATAVVHGTQSLSYGELENRANGVAHALRADGVRSGDRVGVYLNRSLDLVTTLLAVLKIGAVYVPLDPEAPEGRLSHIVTDTGMQLLVTNASLQSLAKLCGLRNILMEDIEAENEYQALPLTNVSGGEHLAYIMYTSGSTGKPKGVAVPHRGVVRLVKNPDYVHLGADTVMAHVSNVAFDAATFEIWGALCNGGRLIVLDKHQMLDSSAFEKAIATHGITTTFLTAALFNSFAQDHPACFVGLKYLLVGGEQVPAASVHRVLAAGKPEHLLNAYGPTENTTFSTWCELDKQHAQSSLMPIGTPISHTQAYVVNEALQLQPTGAVGELVLSGDGLAQGYWEQPELTAKQFVKCPADWGMSCRVYRTGDLVRRLSSGDFQCLGRLDNQVKIRGFRIEPGEIEQCLRSHPDVGEAVVVVNEAHGHDSRQLVAYWVVDKQVDTVPDIEALQQHLAKQLPPYMFPAAYVLIPSLPLTINGKLDRRALPAPRAEDYSSVTYAPPETPLEQQLAAMWEDLLKLNRIGVHTDFFDLGGHSLLLTKLQNRISAQLDTELSLKDLFTARTVREQAKLITSAPNRPEASALPALRPRPQDASPVLSFAQLRLWFIDQMGNAGAVYNIPCALRMTGVLNYEALHQALASVVERHEVLRTTLTEIDGEAQPQVLDQFQVDLPVEDLSHYKEQSRQSEAVNERMHSEAAQPFRLDRDLLLRARLLRLADQEHILLLTLHHIAGDGWSIDVLLSELSELYNVKVAGRVANLPLLAVQYADYAYWQRQWLQGERLESQMTYWEEQLANLPAQHKLPMDFPRPEKQQYHGAVHWQRLPAEFFDQLKHFARSHDMTLFILLQTAFSVLLARWSEDTDIVIGTPIANRRHEGLSPLIGFFANTLVLRTDLSGNPSFIELLRRAREVALDAYEHQDVPIEMLVDRLNPQRSLSHSPLFQIMMALYEGDELPSFEDLEVADIGGESRHAKFDITLNMRQRANGLDVTWEYCTELFRAETIASMAESFRVLLDTVVVDSDRPLGLEFCSAKDRQESTDLQNLSAPEMKQSLDEDYEAPQTTLEKQLASIWCEVLGHERIDVNTFFFDLGGNSLNAVRLMAAIRDATGWSLPISTLFKAPSIRALATEMEQTEKAHDKDVCITLREGGNAQPIFVFHAAGGDVLCYQPLLKHLPDEVPVYGFARSESGSKTMPALKSIEELAEEYLDHIVEVQPEGPLRLVGWSSGGLIALEAAHRLEKRGREVESVGLIDTMFATGREIPERFKTMDLSTIQSMTDAETCEIMREYEPELIETTPRDGMLEISDSDYFNYLVEANQIGLDFYQPAFKLAAPVHYFACEQNCAFKTVDERMGELQVLIKEPMSHQGFDASHFSVMEEPAVAGLGQAMTLILAVPEVDADEGKPVANQRLQVGRS